MRGVGAIAGSGAAGIPQRLARSAQKAAELDMSSIEVSHPLAEQAPGGIAREQLAEQTSLAKALLSIPFHGEPGEIAEVSKETLEQVGAVNAYKTYMAVARADHEIQGALLKIKA